MSIAALDRKINFKLFLKGLSQKIQGVLAKQLPPEQKLELILEEMAKSTQEKRVTARSIRTRMVALADAETTELEPLEALREKRKKLVAVGAKLVKQQDAGEVLTPEESTQLGQLSQEIRALERPLRSMEATYATLKESYEIALGTYRTALDAYERAKANGQTLLLAIKAHQEALSIRDASRKPSSQVDATFIDQLESELDKAQGELHSDQQVDDDLDASKPISLSATFAKADAATVDASLLDEFRAA